MDIEILKNGIFDEVLYNTEFSKEKTLYNQLYIENLKSLINEKFTNEKNIINLLKYKDKYIELLNLIYNKNNFIYKSDYGIINDNLYILTNDKIIDNKNKKVYDKNNHNLGLLDKKVFINESRVKLYNIDIKELININNDLIFIENFWFCIESNMVNLNLQIPFEFLNFDIVKILLKLRHYFNDDQEFNNSFNNLMFKNEFKGDNKELKYKMYLHCILHNINNISDNDKIISDFYIILINKTFNLIKNKFDLYMMINLIDKLKESTIVYYNANNEIMFHNNQSIIDYVIETIKIGNKFSEKM